LTYTLYFSPGACSMAAHIALEELALDYKLELVSIATRETLGADYLKVNAKGRVPALIVDGAERVLTELPAILTYLGLKYPNGPIGFPSDPLLFARTHEWLGWLAGWVHGNGFSMMMLPDRFTTDQGQHAPLKRKGLELVTEAFAEIERLLDGRSFAVQDRYTMADPYLFVMFNWAGRFGFDMRANYPAWTSLVDRLKARPAVQRVIERESEVRMKTHGHPLTF
jgi:glutathione S-transferase